MDVLFKYYIDHSRIYLTALLEYLDLRSTPIFPYVCTAKWFGVPTAKPDKFKFQRGFPEPHLNMPLADNNS